MGQLKLLLGLYFSPLKTFSRILDEGRLLVAILAAVAAAFAFQVPGTILLYRAMSHLGPEFQKQVMHPPAAKAAKDQSDSDEEPEDEPPARQQYTPPILSAINKFTVSDPILFFPWSTLLAVAVCFAPAAIMVITIAEGWRSFCTVLHRDYLALLVCFFMAWTVAYAPLALIRAAQLSMLIPGYTNPIYGWVAHGYFLLLCACAVRVVAGVDFAVAAGATAGGWAGAITGLSLGGVFGFGGYWILSPCLFYALWSRAQREAMWLGSGFSSRQGLKRHLEFATLNPRDADAHCQLGLIYLDRRQLEPAVEQFRAALEIDPEEPDARYHLGCILRKQGKYEEALEHLRIAARIDDKHALSEVWREIGAAALQAGHFDEALEALEKFLERRSYDPEGRCWYGRLMVKLEREPAAERAFQDAIEAVRTMPPARRRQVREWEGQASKDLRMLRESRRRATTRLASVR